MHKKPNAREQGEKRKTAKKARSGKVHLRAKTLEHHPEYEDYDYGDYDEEFHPVVIPVRWLKFIFGIFLLPVVWVFGNAMVVEFTNAAVTHNFWASEEFWFFSMGLVLWLILFFGMPRPMWLYVFGHELTHAIWVWAMGGSVSRFRVSRDGGRIVTDTTNFWIALAPYFFPLYTMLLVLVWCVVGEFYDLSSYRKFFLVCVGMTWGFHMAFTMWMIPKGQSDLQEHGTFFSMVIIVLMNMILLSTLLVVGSSDVTIEGFGKTLITQAMEWSSMVVDGAKVISKRLGLS